MKDMKKIALIGAGNIGSRHLQALKAVKIPLDILVIDPNPESLNIAQERYDSMPIGQCKHTVNYFKNLDKIKDEFDIAIIATHSNIRRKVIEQLFKVSHARALILEKILFTTTEDFSVVRDLLKEQNSQAWVNCTRRVIPFYNDQIKNWFKKKKIIYFVSGSKWSLISNLIHFIDYMSFILDQTDFEIDLNHLDLKLEKSRIPNFLELNGTINLYFNEGSIGVINCYPSGNQPVMIDITSDELRCLLNEGQGKAWVNIKNNETNWKVYDAKILYTSQITTFLVEDILEKNTCSLTSYEESMKLHMLTFEPLLNFLNKNFDKRFTSYPFT
ncbi:MAG: Gfo/Idh/MocA family oxidoreductase [Candidatus Lokiarchaeia archaeon]